MITGWQPSAFSQALAKEGSRPRKAFRDPHATFADFKEATRQEEVATDKDSDSDGEDSVMKDADDKTSAEQQSDRAMGIGSSHMFSTSLKRTKLFIRDCYVQIFAFIWARYDGEQNNFLSFQPSSDGSVRLYTVSLLILSADRLCPMWLSTLYSLWPSCMCSYSILHGVQDLSVFQRSQGQTEAPKAGSAGHLSQFLQHLIG